MGGDLIVEKIIDTRKNKNAPIRVMYPSYGFPCFCSLLILLYVTNILLKKDFFFEFANLIFLALCLRVVIQRRRFREAFLEKQKEPIFEMRFFNDGFTYGYKGSILTTIPYDSIIDYKEVKKSFLIIQAGYAGYSLNLSLFTEEEISEILEILSKLEIKQAKGFRARLNRII